MGWGGTSFASVFIVNYYVPRKNIQNLVSIFIMMVGFILINHRSAYLCFAAVFAIYLLLKSKELFRTLRNSGIVFGASMLAIYQIPTLWDSFIGRVVSSLDTGDENAASRIVRWFIAFNYFLQNPINGSMLKNQYYPDSEMGPNMFPPHNFVFETLSTQGLIGMGFYVALFVLLIRTAFEDKDDPVSVQMLLCVAFYLTFSFMNVTFLNNGCTLLLMLPCAVIMYRRRLRVSAQVAEPGLALSPS